MFPMNAVAPVRSPVLRTRKANVAISAFSAGFILVLAISAYWDRGIRLLHLFESIPYLLAAVLCWRNRKSDYAVGFAAGAFWLWTATALTTFVRNGFERLVMLAATGHVDRPDILIAVPAAVTTGGLALSALWGYTRLPDKRWRDLGLFASALFLVAAWFIGIFALLAPQYLQMFKRLVP
jgi:hypothetical protein